MLNVLSLLRDPVNPGRWQERYSLTVHGIKRLVDCINWQPHWIKISDIWGQPGLVSPGLSLKLVDSRGSNSASYLLDATCPARSSNNIRRSVPYLVSRRRPMTFLLCAN
ncbi:hypothetical protein IG631_08954 [Alternaria alternata]|nr:hypothetical protein IG631_08954 [Alternaria alternata]